MDPNTTRTLLVIALALNASLGLGYRVYRLTKGGPSSDVIGQALLAGVLAVTALGVANEAGWASLASIAYALTFGLIVMPVWVLAVLIPMRPRGIDYAFTATYWAVLVVIALAVIAL